MGGLTFLPLDGVMTEPLPHRLMISLGLSCSYTPCKQVIWTKVIHLAGRSVSCHGSMLALSRRLGCILWLALPHLILFMLAWNGVRHLILSSSKSALRMAQQHLGSATNGSRGPPFGGVSLAKLPKSNVFTQNLPTDGRFPTPADSYKASRRQLGPRMVTGALFTYVRPEEKEDPELFGVSHTAMQDIGFQPGEEQTKDFQQLVSGNKIMWDAESEDGIYPWAQCYGGWQLYVI